MIKVAIVTTLYPETHYSRFLISALNAGFRERLELKIYTDKSEKNKDVPLENVYLVWAQGIWFPWQIFLRVLRDKPQVVHLQHEINMYGRPITAMLFPLLLLLLKLTGARTLVTVHAVVAQERINQDFLATFQWPNSKLSLQLVKKAMSFIFVSILKLSDAVIVHNSCLAKDLAVYSPKNKDKIFVIPIGIPEVKIQEDVDASSVWNRLGVEVAGKKIILNFGYLVRRKGLECLLAAFKAVAEKFQDYILVLAGGTLQPTYVEELKNISRSYNLEDRVIFTSFLSGSEIEEVFKAAQLVVFPYKYSISASLPLAIAMAHQRPIIAAGAGTFAEEIEDGKDGILFSVNDYADLSKKIIQLIEDEGLRKKITDAVKIKSKIRSWSEVAAKTVKLYSALIVMQPCEATRVHKDLATIS